MVSPTPSYPQIAPEKHPHTPSPTYGSIFPRSPSTTLLPPPAAPAHVSKLMNDKVRDSQFLPQIPVEIIFASLASLWGKYGSTGRKKNRTPAFRNCSVVFSVEIAAKKRPVTQ